MKHINTQLLAVTTALLCAGILTLIFINTKHPENDLVISREVIAYEVLDVQGSEVVKYAYRGEPLPEKLAPDEIVILRTENSYTRQIGKEHPGTKEERPILSTVIYQNPVYLEEGGVWYYREEATTTTALFYTAHPIRYVHQLLVSVAHAATLSPFSSAGDGWYKYSALGSSEEPVSSLATCTNASHGSGVESNDTTATTAFIEAKYTSGGFGTCSIRRVYLPFDTSSIPVGSTVTATTLDVYATAKANNVNDGNDLVIVVQGNTSYGGFGATQGATSIDIGDITTSAYNTFTFNATGRGWVTPGGTTKIGLREFHDVLGSITSHATGNTVTFSTSEHTGTTQDPFLSITYTPANFAFWQFQDF